jgi:hypothetical protein
MNAMTRFKRKDIVLEQIVDRGIAIDVHQGAVAAWKYLSGNGVTHDMIIRVLSSPQGRRARRSAQVSIAPPMQLQPEMGAHQWQGYAGDGI